MSLLPTADEIVASLEALASPTEVEKYKRYFKFTGGDPFIGVNMGPVFATAKTALGMPINQIEQLLERDIHGVRAAACSLMNQEARKKKTHQPRRKEFHHLYLRRTERLNNWDLVDLCATYVVGGYLADKPRDILYQLTRSPDIWEWRTSMLATFYFGREMESVDDTFAIAELLLDDPDDLIHKATGWGLRVCGGPRLLESLDRHAATMPRVALRYAIEKLDKEQRTHYLGLKRNSTT